MEVITNTMKIYSILVSFFKLQPKPRIHMLTTPWYANVLVSIRPGLLMPKVNSMVNLMYDDTYLATYIGTQVDYLCSSIPTQSGGSYIRLQLANKT